MLQKATTILAMSENCLHIGFNLSKEAVHSFINEFMQKNGPHKIEEDSFKVTIEKLENVDSDVVVLNKSLLFDLPVFIKFFKDSGLFSVEGAGEIIIKSEIQYDISEDFTLTTKTLILNHEWQSAPVIKLGKLNIPVETISDWVISYMKQNLTEKLDQYVSEKVNLKELLRKHWNEQAVNRQVHQKPALLFTGSINKIECIPATESLTHIQWHLYVNVDAKISDLPIPFEIEINPTFSWVELPPQVCQITSELDLSYSGIAQTIMEEINGVELGGKKFNLENLNITNGERLEIKMNLISPIKAVVTFSCEPYLDKRDQEIHLAHLKTDISPSNFIYKITSPVIEKLLSNKIKEFFPLKLNDYLKPAINNIPQLKVMDGKITISPSIVGIEVVNLELNDFSTLINVKFKSPSIGINA